MAAPQFEYPFVFETNMQYFILSAIPRSCNFYQVKTGVIYLITKSCVGGGKLNKNVTFS